VKLLKGRYLVKMKTNKIPTAPSPLVRRLNAQSDNHSFAFLYITNECQLNCAHCSFKSGPAQHHTRMDERVVIDLLDELRGVGDITITGGEPTLHPGFMPIVMCAAERARVVYLMTNGIHLVGKPKLKSLYERNDQKGLREVLQKSLASFPHNVHFFFPLDSFHLKTFRTFRFLIKGVTTLAKEWNNLPGKAYVGFLSNEVSKEKSQELVEEFGVASSTHIGTALFAPWRKTSKIKEWYFMHPLNRTPFSGGLYINFKGVYLNEASLLVDLREGVETNLKIGILNSNDRSGNQLERLYKKVTFF